VAPYRSDKVTFGFVGAIAAPGRIEIAGLLEPLDFGHARVYALEAYRSMGCG
jgi:hypothetical protein